MATDTISVLTKRDIEKIRFIQNVSGQQMIIPDLGEKGFTIEVDEVVDLHRHFEPKDLSKSQQFDWCLKEGHLSVLEYKEDEKSGDIELEGVVKEKTKPRGEDLPKTVPVEDKEETVYDEQIDEVEEREEEEDAESKLGSKRRSQKGRDKQKGK